MTSVSVTESRLTVGSETIRFPAPIAEHVEYDEFVVVRLKVTMDEHPDDRRNVIAVDRDGTIRWQLPELPDAEPRPYTRIFTKEGEDLWVHNSSGNLYRVDPETGEVLDREFVK